MQRYEVEAIFEQKKDGLFEDINISSQKPIAIILGGQLTIALNRYHA